MKTKKIPLLVIFIFLLVTLLAGFWWLISLIGKRQEIRMRAAPASSLYFSPLSLTTSVGETFTLEVMLETETNIVPAVEMYIVFNPTVFQATNLGPGVELPEVFDGPQIDNSIGVASIVVGDVENPVEGLGTVASISFQTISLSSEVEKIDFSSQTQAGAWHEEGINVLRAMNGAEITILSPTLTPTLVPTNTPTATPSPIPAASPTPSLVPTSTISPSPSPIPTLLPTSTPTPTPAPTVTPSPTPTPIPLAEFLFKLKFQGIDGFRTKKPLARLTFKQGDEVKYASQEVEVTADDQGVFSGRMTGIEPGVYDILVKGWSHLQKEFTGISLSLGENNKDWSQEKLLAGDAWPDNIVDIFDVAILSQDYGFRFPAEGSRADFDLDGDVDIYDLTYISENFSKKGDGILNKSAD